MYKTACGAQGFFWVVGNLKGGTVVLVAWNFIATVYYGVGDGNGVSTEDDYANVGAKVSDSAGDVICYFGEGDGSG